MFKCLGLSSSNPSPKMPSGDYTPVLRPTKPDLAKGIPGLQVLRSWFASGITIGASHF